MFSDVLFDSLSDGRFIFLVVSRFRPGAVVLGLVLRLAGWRPRDLRLLESVDANPGLLLLSLWHFAGSHVLLEVVVIRSLQEVVYKCVDFHKPSVLGLLIDEFREGRLLFGTLLLLEANHVLVADTWSDLLRKRFGGWRTELGRHINI